MNYFDPNRKKLVHFPAFMREGEALCKMPGIWLCPCGPGRVDVSIWAVVGPTSGELLHYEIGLEELPGLMAAYEADPEQCLERYWNYKGPLAPTKKKDLSLNDLDL